MSSFRGAARPSVSTLGLLGVFTVLLLPAPARADVLTFELGGEFSGGSDPSGTPPWLQATFTDVAPGEVDLELTSLLQSSTEFVSQWLFNLDPLLDPNNLSFSFVAGTAASSISPLVDDTDAYKADGDGFFDIQFNWTSNTFTQGSSATYTLTSSDSITVDSFDFPSAMGGGQGVFGSAAHVQGINVEDSGWIGATTTNGGDGEIVPEPSSIALLAAGGILLVGGFLRSRRRRAVGH